ncbi:MAG TPA: hypothetical protein VE130_15975 [Nitrososphaeraceae archaeon]|jgi:uncharacterized membrane protein|nr:hypothetical protein [Nitrososphaeraceae archaeon]
MGFVRSSFYPFFPWDQTKPRKASIDEAPNSSPVNTTGDPKSILKIRLAKGEITVDEYKNLTNLMSK